MPSSQVIVAGLAQISNRTFALAVAIHVLLGLVGIACALGARPTQRIGLLLVGALCGTVALVALGFGNPFNATAFGLLSAAYALTALRARARLEPAGAPWARAVGWGLLVFGWTYPHFLEHISPFAYLIGAPLGLVPCPTLAFSVGLALTGLVSTPPALSRLLGLFALFYGLFGVFRLGVTLDAGLLFGGLALTFLQLRSSRPRSLSTP